MKKTKKCENYKCEKCKCENCATSERVSIPKIGFKIIITVALGLVIIFVTALEICRALASLSAIPALPAPELSEGMRGELGIDKNINEKTIDNYLGRSDSVYRDMRMLKDEANYEKIDGDSYISGIVKGFEVVSLPYLMTPENLPEEVGKSYSGETLFNCNKVTETCQPNYKESMAILEDLFPKNKNIFLLCGGGGYAGMTKKLLVGLGWDENKIYNVGGYWYYEGNNKIDIKMTISGADTYAFWRLNYHTIDFKTLHEV